MVSLKIRDKLIAPASPWQNGFAERPIGSIRRECVDHIIVSGEERLRRILKNHADYYNGVRTHRALSKDAPISRQVQRPRVITSHAWWTSPSLRSDLGFRYTQVLEGIEWSVSLSCELDCHPRPKTRNAHATISIVKALKTIIMIGAKIMLTRVLESHPTNLRLNPDRLSSLIYVKADYDYNDMIYAATPEEIAIRRKAFIRKWRLKHRAVADSLEEAGDRLFTFTRLPPSQWRSVRTTNAIERLHEEFKRRIKTQTVLPSADTAAMLFWALLASGQINMRKVDGWQTLATKPIDQPIDLAARPLVERSYKNE